MNIEIIKLEYEENPAWNVGGCTRRIFYKVNGEERSFVYHFKRLEVFWNDYTPEGRDGLNEDLVRICALREKGLFTPNLIKINNRKEDEIERI